MKTFALLAALALSPACTTAAAGSFYVAGGGSGAGTASEAYDIEVDSPTFTALSLNAEFAGSISPWVLGSNTLVGTASMTAPPATPIADLTTRSGSVILQAMEGGGAAAIYAVGALADGEELIVSMSMGYGQESVANNSIALGVSFSNSATSWNSGTIDRFYWDGGDDGIAHWDGSVKVAAVPGVPTAGGRLYWRVIREGDDLLAYWSRTGDVWAPLSEADTVVRGHTHMWIFVNHPAAALSGLNLTSPVEVRWVRHLAHADVYPW